MRHKLGKLDKAPLNIRILLDSGATKSIVFYNAAKKLRLKRDTKRTVWTTLAGQFETNQKTEVLFKLNEFDKSTTVRHDFTVCKQKSNYDMIIGVDLMTKLGIILNFGDKTMQWKHVSVPMKNRDATRHTSFFVAKESVHVADATDRIRQILDAKYEPANLEEVAKANPELNKKQQDLLLTLLRKYSSLFDGTIGKWKGKPYDIELKPGVSPYHARSYPIPKAYENTFQGNNL